MKTASLFLIIISLSITRAVFGQDATSNQIEQTTRVSLGLYVQPDFVTAGNYFWKNTETGIGLNRNLTYGLKGSYGLSDKLELTLSAGIANWTLIRNYTEEGLFLYREHVKMLRVPILAGVKYRLNENFFLSPEIGGTLIKSTTQSTEFGEEVSTGTLSKTAFSYGGAIGYEKQFGPVLIDLSGRYQVIGYNKGHLASIRLGASYVLR